VAGLALLILGRYEGVGGGGRGNEHSLRGKISCSSSRPEPQYR
jgi:hypothetical protein